MKKIIVSGNKHYGLSKSIYKKFPEAEFFSRSNGDLNLIDENQMDEFVNKSMEFDIYISCSYLPYFKQLMLLGKLWSRWNKEKKKGQIIVLGSTADWQVRADLYCLEKKSLRDFCNRFGRNGSGGGPNLYPGNGIRMTYLAPGMIDLPKQREKRGLDLAKLDPEYIVDVIEWLLQQPENINIYELSMDPVQYKKENI